MLRIVGPLDDGMGRCIARGIIRFVHEGWDETADATYRREIMSLLAE